MILKIKVTDSKDYTNSVEHLLKDPKKFQILDADSAMIAMK